jgi:hypothetical protein
MSPKAQRIPVRIAVAVDRNGFWSAVGSCAYESTEETAQAALDYLPQESTPPRHVVWVSADVPLPVAEVVQGVVGSVVNG